MKKKRLLLFRRNDLKTVGFMCKLKDLKQQNRKTRKKVTKKALLLTFFPLPE